jgi:hypothetical protein
MLIVDLSSDLSPSPSSNHQSSREVTCVGGWGMGKVGVGRGLEISVS